jgi:hypothetical protein
MPNHCTNLVTLVGAPAEVARAAQLLRGVPPEYAPHPNPLFKASDEDKKPVPFCFHNVIPVPPEVLAAGFDRAGYDWQRDHWGTKWDAYSFDTDYEDVFKPGESTIITYKFDTAWAPPSPVLAALARRFPELRVYHSYGEEYPTRGRAVWADGKHHEVSDSPPDGGLVYELLRGGLFSHWEVRYLAEHAEWVATLEAARP